MLIVAVDPGLTTGIAVWNDGRFHSEENDDPMMTLLGLDFAIEKADHIVCENFVPRPRVTWQPDALHIIGTLRYLCWRAQVPFHLPKQGGNTAKSYATDERLKKAGFYVPGKGHANDAARHLLKFLVRQNLISAEDIL